MARDSEPLTDAEIEDAREAIRAQRADIRDYLASEGVDVSGWDAPDDGNEGAGTSAEPADD